MEQDSYSDLNTAVTLPYQVPLSSPEKDCVIYFDVIGNSSNWHVKGSPKVYAFGIDLTEEFSFTFLLQEIYKQQERVTRQIEDQEILEMYSYLHPYDD